MRDTMSDTSEGPGSWQASDGKWYPPEPTSQPQPPSPASGAPAYGGPPSGSGLPSVNGLAVASMVLGIVGIVFSWCWVGLVCSLVGLPMGGVALSKIRNGAADPRSKGMATAGLVLTIITLALWATLAIFLANTANEFNDFLNS